MIRTRSCEKREANAATYIIASGKEAAEPVNSGLIGGSDYEAIPTTINYYTEYTLDYDRQESDATWTNMVRDDIKFSDPDLPQRENKSIPILKGFLSQSDKQSLTEIKPPADCRNAGAFLNLVLTKSTRVSKIVIDIGVESEEYSMSSKKERTREMILQASYRLFARDGFNKITMKDVCDATGMSRGGLYSHFSGTKELFEAILLEINKKDEMDFYKEMNEGLSAVDILDRALVLMRDEMEHAEDSLSLAMYEYAGTVSKDMMNHFNQIGEEKWTAVIEYGMERGEFQNVDVAEIVNVILYVYQGVRMWSRIVSMTPAVFDSITNHIRKQLVKEP